MFPPPPLPPHAPTHRHAQHAPPRAMAMRLSAPPWYPYGLYGSRYAPPPPRHETFVPRQLSATVSKAAKPASDQAVKPKVVQSQALVKEPEPKPCDNQTKRSPMEDDGDHTWGKIWLKKQAKEPEDNATSFKKSMWQVSPAELAFMMKRERSAKRATAPKVGMHKIADVVPRKKKAPVSNEETRDRSSPSSSSDTESEDDELPTLKLYHGLLFLSEFPSDGNENESRDDNAASEGSDRAPGALSTQRHFEPAAPDYRKLFDIARPSTFARIPTYPPPDVPTPDDGKQPPHMSWWPGDWKCGTCGNHNFSYRELCKRCREGRYHDAGFIYPTKTC